MRPLKEFKGKWDPAGNSVVFEWNPKELDADCFIGIIEVTQGPGGFSFIESNNKLVDLKTEKDKNKAVMELRTAVSSGVSAHWFFGGSFQDSREWGRDSLNSALKESKVYLTKVMLGKADIDYFMKPVKKNEATLVRFTVKTSANIDPCVLGYTYRLGNDEIVNSFPAIPAGRKIEYPPIAVPPGTEVFVKPYSEECSGNINIRFRKFPLFEH